MKAATLALLRCPYCGGALELVRDYPHRADASAIHDGVIACECCLFPVVSGVPVMHLGPDAERARTAVEAGDFGAAFRALIAPNDEERASTFEAMVAAGTATYVELVEALGEGFERGYFRHRFSDPSYAVASQVVAGVAGRVLKDGGRAIDLCGGSGHLTRSLLTRGSLPPVIADLYFAKVWLATNYVAPGCEAVCCDGNAPFPFERGSFRYAMCADAFMFIWTKRQFVSEMARLLDGPGPRAAVITHTHNANVWSPSHGQPLSAAGYRNLFETLDVRLYAEGALLDDVVAGGGIDLGRRDDPERLDADPAFTIVASNDDAVYRRHAPVREPSAPGVVRVNPLYAVEEIGGELRLQLSFPSEDYEEEFGESRRYLPEAATIDAATAADLAAGRRSPAVERLLEQRIALELPEGYC